MVFNNNIYTKLLTKTSVTFNLKSSSIKVEYLAILFSIKVLMIVILNTNANGRSDARQKVNRICENK